MNNELYHYGVLGMRWGVRRYQNKDGSLTSAGRKHSKKTSSQHEDYVNAHSKKSVSAMSDAELRSRNNRLQMEQQYQNLTKKTSTGKKIVMGLISAAGTITAAQTAYKTYSKLGKRAGDVVVDKIGDWILADLRKGLAKGL